MARTRIARALAGLSLALAVAALLFLAFWPHAYRGESVQLSPDGGVIAVESTSSSLIEQNGLGIIWVLVFPAGVAGAGLMASFRPGWPAKATLWAAALILTLFAWATGLSVGPFFFPAALALLLAATVYTRAQYAT